MSMNSSDTGGSNTNSKTTPNERNSHASASAAPGKSKSIIAVGGLLTAACAVLLQRIFFGGKHTAHGQPSKVRNGNQGATASTSAPVAAGPLSKLKPTQKCVALADGSGCVIRRTIAGDNSCLFNAVGYGMHKVRTRSAHLRSVVAATVSSDRQQYTEVVLEKSNDEYCNWIKQSHTWGGGIELSILSKAYAREISAWSIESMGSMVFGEESGFKKQVMVIYTGNHYDALAIATSPKADPANDETDFNPRTKRGKMILAAAKKLVEITNRNSPFYVPKAAVAKTVLTTKYKTQCDDCKEVMPQKDAKAHAQKTGHQKYTNLS